jgi:hypothetical protein
MTKQLWFNNVKQDLYVAGFNPDWTDELESELRGWFTSALRTLYEFAPVLVTDDAEDE